MRKIVRLLTWITILIGTTHSFAFADGFYYLAADTGYTKLQDVCASNSAFVNGTGCKNSSGAIRIAGGFQWAPLLGTEISYGYYGKGDLGNKNGVTTGEWKASGLEISGILSTKKFKNGLSFLLRLGAARTKLNLANSSPTNIDFVYGVGVRYDYTPDVGIRIQYEDLGDVGNSTSGTTGLTLYTAGIVLRY